MSLDLILLWLSAKGQGSWSQFREAVEELYTQQQNTPLDPDDEGSRSSSAYELPLYQQVRFALQRLAHVEFYSDAAQNRWRVVPPTVAFVSDSSDSGFLCGARSPALLERFNHATDLEVLVSQFEGNPERIIVRGASHDVVVARATALGLKVQKQAPLALLSALPCARDSSAWHRSSMPDTPGWLVHRFSASQRSWLEVSQTHASTAYTGLFRFVMKYQRFYYLRWRGSSYSVPVQIGKYAIAPNRSRILAYDAERRTLSVPVSFRPPLLIERALVLCSGRLPSLDSSSRRLEYAEVPAGVANLAAQLLHQEVR